MGSVIKSLTRNQLIRPPAFVENGTQYEVYMGSVAYGVSDDISDVDIYGFCIPSKDTIFPHLRGVIPGFGKQIQRFEQYQQHHVFEEGSEREYDLSIYSIVKYFQLCMENNPNMIDSLFVPDRCVAYMTPVGSMVRDNRHMFLHKGSFHKYKGYAHSQLHKCRTKKPEGKRKELIEKYGYDVKFAYHIKRLLLQIEQIMAEETMDLQRNREELKAIRRGEVLLEEVEKWKAEKELQLEKLYNESKLPYKPDESKIKQLLIDCLEEHFGSLSVVEYSEPDLVSKITNEIQGVINKYKR